MPWKNGGGERWAQSNFPTRDHQNIFNLILIYMYSDGIFECVGGGGGGAQALLLWKMKPCPPGNTTDYDKCKQRLLYT